MTSRTAIIRRAGLGLALLCAASAGAVAVFLPGRALLAGPAEAGRAAPARAACPSIPRGTQHGVAQEVGTLFVRSAVLRQNPRCARALVTNNVRLPVEPFPFSDADRLRARVIPRVTLPDEFGSWLILDDGLGRQEAHELVLVRQGQRWLVDYWAPAPGILPGVDPLAQGSA